MSEEQQSNIPFLDEVNDQQHIVIQSLALEDYLIGDKLLVIEHGHGNAWQQVTAPVYKIDHRELGYYIPSKVLAVNGHMHAVYYTNPDLPNAVKPFEDGICYAWALAWNPNTHFRYPALSRVFIDQVIMGNTIKTLFMASSSTYESLLAVPERKIDLDGELAMYHFGADKETSAKWRT
jgi:hypothetical protein